MPKFPKPFFPRDRGRDRGWFVQVGKQQIKLADGPENKETEAAALKRYHEFMADAGRDKSATPLSSAPDPTGWAGRCRDSMKRCPPCWKICTSAVC